MVKNEEVTCFKTFLVTITYRLQYFGHCTHQCSTKIAIITLYSEFEATNRSVAETIVCHHTGAPASHHHSQFFRISLLFCIVCRFVFRIGVWIHIPFKLEFVTSLCSVVISDHAAETVA